MQSRAKREQDLRNLFKNMDADKAQEIRQAYYAAVCGLDSLARLLEGEDADEHARAIKADAVMANSMLGRIL